MIFFLFAFLVIKVTSAQTVTFENFNGYFDSNAVNYFKGTPGVPGDYIYHEIFASFALRNDTSAFGDYWSGWAISRLKDSISIAYDTNDCAAFPAVLSSTYATAYQSIDSYYNRIRFDMPIMLDGVSITNSTIAYRSMQNGDFVAKKFGGVSGNDSDYFRIIFKGWENGILKPDSVLFYLADFRDPNNANDYIVKYWEYVNLQTLGVVDSIYYYLESSDNGPFGMNTPAYFCIDNLVDNPESVKDISLSSNISIFPNPFSEELTFCNKSEEIVEISVMDFEGRNLIEMNLIKNQQHKLQTRSWSQGMYFIKVKSQKGEYFKKIVK